MLALLDLCCLKRPFDDQSQARIRVESEAVLSLLGAEPDRVQFVRSESLILENSRNRRLERAKKVTEWLTSAPLHVVDHIPLQKRISELMTFGLKGFDALHLATAELVRADFLASCDDRFLAAARRNATSITVRVLPILDLAQEILK